jgi:hypothetical protein
MFGLAQDAGGVTSGATAHQDSIVPAFRNSSVSSHGRPLTPPLIHPIPLCVSRLDGRSGKGRKVAGEESPGSMDMRCRITSGGGNPRDSATENKPPRRTGFGVRRGKGEMVR